MLISFASSFADVHCLGDAPFTPEDFLNLLIPNFWTFLIQLLALIVLILAIIFLAYKPIKKVIKKRGDYVEGNIKESEGKVVQANEKLDEAQKNVLQSRTEAQKIIKKAEGDAVIVKDGIINDAKVEADKQITSAREQIKLEQQKAKDDVHKEIVDVAMSASEKLLSREINDKDNDKLVSNFVDDIQKKDKK